MHNVEIKMAFIVGFLTGLFEAIHLEDIGKTIVLTAIGATTSYLITRCITYLHKKIKR